MTLHALVSLFAIFSQAYGQPDRGQPGDEMIQAFLAKEAVRLDAQFAEDFASKDAWEAKREQYKEEYLYMLGLWPLPEKTPLKATITGTLERDGYVVEKLHYQSKPGLYVTGNVYRPAERKPGEKFPAVLYVCGHSNMGRDGSKTAYQSHPIWLAKHGFICLIVDTLEFGEINDFPRFIHHGTYNLERWWWHSRGYTPAGVECWNGVRGIDYLLSRDDVDPERIGVTGISGGGAATFWIAAADERVTCAVPISGMADLESYVGNRMINGHCDCMFLYNTFQWPWTRIAALVAPRPMLFMNSDHDGIFPMDANDRITNRMERLYSLYGASDKFDTVVSVGGHAYREDIRRAAYAFLQYHLQNKADPVTDSEVDLADTTAKLAKYPIPPEELRVFPADADLPKDALNKTIDEHFVPLAEVKLPKKGEFEAWKKDLLTELRRVVFRSAESVSIASHTIDQQAMSDHIRTSQGIEFEARLDQLNSVNIRAVILNAEEKDQPSSWKERIANMIPTVIHVEPRGTGKSRWTSKNPPNYVERSHALLGQTVDTGKVVDLLAALNDPESDGKRQTKDEHYLQIAGRGRAGLIAAYTAVLHEKYIQEVALIDPPTTHMSTDAPQFLNILRVCDVPEMLGLIAPRRLSIITSEPEKFANTVKLYQAAGAEKALTISKPE